MRKQDALRRFASYELFVFDLDDTLILERDYVRSGFQAVGHHLWRSRGLDGFAEEAWRLFLMGRRREVFDEVLLSRGIAADEALIDELVAVYRAHRSQAKLLPDARELLRFVKHGGQRIALISDGAPEGQRSKLKGAGIEDCFDSLVLTGEFGPEFHKSNRAAFEWVQTFLGADPAETVYLADNPLKDFDAPRELGWGSVRVRRSAGIYSRIDGPACVPEVKNLFELSAALRPIGTPAAPAAFPRTRRTEATLAH